MTDAGTITSMIDPTDESNIDPELKTYDALTGSEVIPTDQSITMNVRKLTEKVLSANAMVFRDNWEVEMQQNENPYQVGQLGIWRPYKSYVYAGDRSQTIVDGVKTPRIQQDGMMSNVPFFNWQVSDYERYIDKWEWSGEVTRLNKFGFETENKDRLGIYSSALYGYNHAFVIGVGGNATYQELATQDFELYNPSLTAEGDQIAEARKLENEGNMFFHCATTATSNRTIYQSDKFKILGGKIGVTNFVYLDGAYDAGYWAGITKIDLAISTSNNAGKQDLRMFRANIIAASSPTEYGVSPYTKVEIEVDYTAITESGIAYLPTANHLGGMATVYKENAVDNIDVFNAAVTIANEGHTGKQALKIEPTVSGGYVVFKHGKLQLIPGKRYVLSYWAKRDDTNVYDYNLDTRLQINSIGGDVANLIIAEETKAGRIVNGWQKMEVEFELNPALYTEKHAIKTTFIPGANAMYIDDIRISPKTGGIVTYVYNPNNFRLVATLSANNYATLYYYDEQGNLYLTKQETEEGIVTISGSHSHSRSN